MPGYDWPFGDADSRAVAIDKLPEHWEISNPYASWYEIQPAVFNWHTGIDVVMHYPTFNSEINQPLYAIADGMVLYSGIGGGTWGWIIVIAHVDEAGKLFITRTAHGNHQTYTPVKTGDFVTCGQELIPLGNADGTFPYHVHFDISRTAAMYSNPGDWPGADKTRILKDYVDPVAFIIARKKAQQPPVVIVPDPVPAGVTDTIIDLSSNNVISDPAAFKAWLVANKVTILHRATEGDGSDNWIDPMFIARRAEYGPLCTFGAYHLLNGDDPVKQADNFVNVVKPDGKTPLAQDVELAASTPALALAFESRLATKVDKPCMTYTRAGFWGDAPAGSGPLWISSQHTPPVLPSRYSAWDIQQHAQTTVPGVTGVVDRDWFNGTPDQLAAFWVSVSGQVTARPTAKKYVIVSEGNTLNIRDAQSATGVVVGSYPRGVGVEIYTDNINNGYAQLTISTAQDKLFVATAWLSDTDPK